MNAELLPGTFAVSREFDAAAFDCGVPGLNDWLKKFALQNHANLSAKTFVALRGTRIVGYYSLTVTSAERDEPPERVTKGLARHPVPLLLIARLAVDQSEKGHGLGRALMKDALRRIVKGGVRVAMEPLVHLVPASWPWRGPPKAPKISKRSGFTG